MNPTLIVNTWSSKCGNCGQGCSPNEDTHETVLGYTVPEGATGCGVRWTQIDSEYMGLDLSHIRPDLKRVGLLA